MKQILIGVALPGIISLLVLWLAWASAKAVDDRRWRTWAGALAFGAAFCVSHFFLLGWPEYPPVDVVNWLPWFALAAVIIGLIDSAARPSYMLLWLIRLAASGAAVWLLLEPLIRSSWPSDRSYYWVAWLGIGIAVLWSIIDETTWRVKGWATPLALALATLALSLSLLWHGSAMYFQIGLILAATVGAAYIASLRWSWLTLSSGAVPVFVLLYYGLLVCGYFFTGMPQVNFSEFKLEQLCAPLLAIAPAFAGWALSGKMHRNRAKQAAMAFFWVVIPAGLGALLAFLSSLNSAGGY